jgi:peptidoglycan/xylan/chitin deacetylase (PgdA/CDA1 family)
MSILKPIFDAEGIVGTSAVITGRLDKEPTHMTTPQLKELVSAGWTVCNHTHTHAYLGDITEAENEYEIKTTKDILNNLGMDGDIIVYPYGSVSDITKKVARKHTVLGIGDYNKYNPMPINTYHLARFGDISGNTFDLAACQAIVDNAPPNSWIIFYTHVLYDMWQLQETKDKLHSLIQHIKTKGYEIVNIREGLNRKANILDTGNDNVYFKVGRDGTIGEKQEVFYPTDLTNTTPITTFPLGESFIDFDYDESVAAGFGINVAGVLKTFRMPYSTYHNKEIFSYQTYQPYSDNTYYRRRWDDAGKTWTPWIRYNSPTNWVGMLYLNTVFREIGDTRCVNYVDFEKIHSTAATQITLTKTLWAASEISTDSLNPTTIGTAGTINLQVYRDALTKAIFIKYSASGNNGSAFTRTSWA